MTTTKKFTTAPASSVKTSEPVHQPLPSEADIIRLVGGIRYQELRSKPEPISPYSSYWGPDYDD